MDSQNYKLLIEKLDHPIDEIKCRALVNICSKIQRDLIFPEALNSPILVQKLLEWLDQQPLLYSANVLHLLQTLVTKESLRSILVHANGLAILTRTRNTITDGDLRQLIDELFVILSDGAVGTPGGHVNSSTTCRPMPLSGYFEFSGSSLLTSTSAMSTVHQNQFTRSRTQNADYSFPFSSSNNVTNGPSQSSAVPANSALINFPVLLLTKTDTDVLSASINSIKSTHTESAVAGIRFFRDVILEDFAPEVFIQRPKMIESILQLLTCSKARLVLAACESLIGLCEKLVARIYFHLDPNNFTTFGTPINGSYRSDSLSTNRQPQSSLSTDERTPSDSRQSAAGAYPAAPPDLDPSLSSMNQTIQSSPNPLLQFISTLLHSVALSLQVHVPVTPNNTEPNTSNRASNISPEQDARSKLDVQLMRLLRSAVRLMLSSVKPLDHSTHCPARCTIGGTKCTAWDCQLMHCAPLRTDAISPVDLPAEFPASLAAFGSLLSSLSSSWIEHQQDELASVGWSASELTQAVANNTLPYELQRHVYLSVLSNVFHMIQSLFTIDTALSIVPTDLRNQLALALLDVGVYSNSAAIAAGDTSNLVGLPTYVLLFNSGVLKAWKLLAQLGWSMAHLVHFLEEYERLVDNATLTAEQSEKMLQLATIGMDAMDVVGSIRFSSDFVQFLNVISISEPRLSSALLWSGQMILLRLLSHPTNAIRRAGYSQLKEVVRYATHPTTVADPTQLPNSLEFLLREEVLCECLEYGLRDSCEEIRSIVSETLSALFNAYGLLPQASWRLLHRLCMRSTLTTEEAPPSWRPVPLNLYLAPYAHTLESKNTESCMNSALGPVALDWCLGRMTATGRLSPLDQPKQSGGFCANTSEPCMEADSLVSSRCRLLLHPDQAVRALGAQAIVQHLYTLFSRSGKSETTWFSDRPPDGQSTSGGTTSEMRLVTGASATLTMMTQPDMDAAQSRPTERQTSTPVDQDDNLVKRLINLLVPDASTMTEPADLLDHPDCLCADVDDPEAEQGLLRVLQLFHEPQADLNVRRAAGEQAVILIKRPLLLTCWFVNHGVELACQLTDQLAHECTTSQSSPDPTLPPSASSMSSSASCVLLPVLVRLVRFAAVWHESVRMRLAQDSRFLLQLLFLRLTYSSSGSMHRDFLNLVALLLFEPVIQSAEEHPVCLPIGIPAGFLLPFTCPTYSVRQQWRTSVDVTNRDAPFQPLLDLVNMPPSDAIDEARFTTTVQHLVRRGFRQLWAVACHGSSSSSSSFQTTTFDALPLIEHSLAMIGALPPSPDREDPKRIDACFEHSRTYTPYLSQLSLSAGDLALLLLSHPKASLFCSLTAIRQATSHKTVLRAFSLLRRAVETHSTLPTQHDPDTGTAGCICWWEYAGLDRFLSTLPACSADYHLLTNLLELIDYVGLLMQQSRTPAGLVLSELGSTIELCRWLLNLLVHQHGPITYCLLQPAAGVGETDSHRLVSSKQRLVFYDLPRFVHHLTDRLVTERQLGASVLPTSVRPASPVSTTSSSSTNPAWFRLCLKWAQTAMTEFATTPFSDLVRLRLVLGVLCNLSSASLWQPKYDHPWLLQLLTVTTNLLSQFDAGRDEACDSFMGAGSLRLMLTLVNHFMHRLQASPSVLHLLMTDDGTTGIQHSTTPQNTSSMTSNLGCADWLLRCIVYRSVEVRALALCILGRLCLLPCWARQFTAFQPSSDTRTLLAVRNRKLPPSGGRLWCLAIATLCDPTEACVCLVAAVQLLTNLTTLPMNLRDSGIFVPPTIESKDTVLPPPPRTDGNMAPLQPDGIVTSDSNATRHSSYMLDANHTSSSLPNVEEAVATLHPPEESSTMSSFPQVASVESPVPAGDRPLHPITRSSSSVVDLRQLFNSDLESDQLRANFTELLSYLQPWLHELLADDSMEDMNILDTESAVDPRGRPPWLIHTSVVPQDTLLPCCFDEHSGLYLLGLPALQQLLIGQNLLNRMHQLLSAYWPQPLFEPSRWMHLVSGVATNSFSTTDTNETVPTSSASKTNASAGTFSMIPHSTPVLKAGECSTTGVEGDKPHVVCTPMLVGCLCRLATNLMHHLPKFVPNELNRLRVNTLLMNIVDPTLLDAMLRAQPRRDRASPWYTNMVPLISAFTGSLRLLRCQAAMHESVVRQLSADARFLARLIRSLKLTDHMELMAPFWHELFTLLTCLLLNHSPSNDGATSNLPLRLLLTPLSGHAQELVSILLQLIERAENLLADLGSEATTPESVATCKHARAALLFLTVVIAQYRPLSGNPVIQALDDRGSTDSTPTKTPMIASLARCLMSAANTTTSVSDSATGRTSLSVLSLTDGNQNRLPGHVLAYRRALLASLRTVLGVCQTAKIIALEDGFMEQLLMSIQLLQLKLAMCCCSLTTDQTTSGPGLSRKAISQRQKAATTWISLTDELVAQFEILHNLVYNCTAARKRVIDAGLPQLVPALWPLALQDNRILHGLLDLLTNLTADCPYASSALTMACSTTRPSALSLTATTSTALIAPVDASSNGPSSSRFRTALGQDGTVSSAITANPGLLDAPGAPTSAYSIVQSLCRLLQPILARGSGAGRNSGTAVKSGSARALVGANVTAPNDIVASADHQEVTCRFVFQLLSNLVWASESRSALLKAKLLHHFVELDVRVVIKSRRTHFLLLLWLQLLTSLSFTKDGQQMLLLQPRLVESVHDCVIHSKGYTRETGLLIIRNLCTSSALKSRLFAGDTQMLACLRETLEGVHNSANSIHLVSLAVSAVRALMHGNQKMRVLIRSAGYLRFLTSLLDSCQKSPEFSSIAPKIHEVIAQLQA